jgi:hypothetical protein
MGKKSWRLLGAAGAFALAVSLSHAVGAQTTSAPTNADPAVQAPPPLPVAVDPPPAPPLLPANTNADTANCDGYGNFMRSGDGMLQQGMGLWQPAGDRIRRTPSWQNGIGYCTRALTALETQFPQFWMRRVSLLQARALHRLLDGDAPAALADLDAADAAATDPSDIFYQRSLNINTNLIRAFALVEKGDRAAGEALAMQTWRRRPYSREVIGAALTVLGAHGAPENIEALLRAEAQVDPSYSDAPFVYLFENERWADALALSEDIQAPRPTRDQTYDERTSIQRAEEQRAIDTLFKLALGGHRAYALAALGRDEEARAWIGEADQVLQAGIVAPTPLPERPTNRDRIEQTVREQVNLEIQTNGPLVRDVWVAIVNARLQARSGRSDDIQHALLSTPHLPPSIAIVDTLRAAGAPAAMLDALRARLPDRRFNLPPHDIKELFSLLLDAESASRANSRVTWEDRLFMSGDAASRGGCSEAARTDGAFNVCYLGSDATLAVTEERALIRASAVAMAQNAPRFDIVTRRDIQHSIVSTMYGTPISQSQAGFESRLVVRPHAAGDQCWRCIGVEELRAQLAAVYAPGRPQP